LRTGSSLRVRDQSSPTSRGAARIVPTTEEGEGPKSVLRNGGSFKALKQSSYRVLPPSAALPQHSLSVVDIEAGELFESVRSAKRRT
jgi:hypothetical protein